MDAHVWVKSWNQEKRTELSDRLVTLDYEEELGFTPAEVTLKLSGKTDIATGDLLTLKAFDGQKETDTVFVGKVRKKARLLEKGCVFETITACDSRITFGCTDYYALDAGSFSDKFLGLLHYLNVTGRCVGLNQQALRTERATTLSFKTMLEHAAKDYERQVGKTLYTHLDGADVVCEEWNPAGSTVYTVQNPALLHLAQTEDAVSETITRVHLAHNDSKTGPQSSHMIMEKAAARWDVLMEGKYLSEPLTAEVKKQYASDRLIRAAKPVRLAELSALGSWKVRIGRKVSADAGVDTPELLTGRVDALHHRLEGGIHQTDLVLRLS